MKNLLLCIALAASLTSCLSGSKAARDEGLLPAASLAWGNDDYGVRSDTLRGIADAVDDGDLVDAGALLGFVDQMGDALEARDRSALRTVPWATLSPYAERGIQDRVDDGEMVEQAAVFLTRRLENFNRAIEVLTDPAYAGLLPVKPKGPSGSPTVPTPQGPVPLVAAVAR